MEQRLTINEDGRIVLHTNNGEYCEGDWSGKIGGDFMISAENVAKLLANKNGDSFEFDCIEISISGKMIYNYKIMPKDSISKYKAELEEKLQKDCKEYKESCELDYNKAKESLDSKISSLKSQIDKSDESIYYFNSLPFWKKAFYKFKI